jgi:hypothetical protein
MQVVADRAEAPTAIQTELRAIFVSLELSRSTWLITSLSRDHSYGRLLRPTAVPVRPPGSGRTDQVLPNGVKSSSAPPSSRPLLVPNGTGRVGWCKAAVLECHPSVKRRVSICLPRFEWISLVRCVQDCTASARKGCAHADHPTVVAAGVAAGVLAHAALVSYYAGARDGGRVCNHRIALLDGDFVSLRRDLGHVRWLPCNGGDLVALQSIWGPRPITSEGRQCRLAAEAKRLRDR